MRALTAARKAGVVIMLARHPEQEFLEPVYRPTEVAYSFQT